MQKIGLLELANHNEVLRAYLLILLESDQLDSVVVFTSKWNFNQLYDFHSHEKLTWIIIKDVSELGHHHEEIKKLSLLIQTTIEDAHAKVLEFEPLCKLAIVIHKANSQFVPFRHLKFSMQALEFVKDIGRLLKFVFVKRPALKKVEKKADILFFPSPHALKLANNKEKEMRCFPFVVNDEQSKIFTRDKIHITIPGIITDKSRDYIEVIDAINSSKSKNLKLTLLGRPKGKYGKKVIDEFQKLENLELHFFDSFIQQKEFDDIMRSTDFLILPMKEKMKFGVIEEDNGYSCVSGNINDMIRYGIPALIPQFYPISEGLNTIVGKYKDAIELGRLIDNWVENRHYNFLKKEMMHKAMKPYDKKVMSQIVQELI